MCHLPHIKRQTSKITLLNDTVTLAAICPQCCDSSNGESWHPIKHFASGCLSKNPKSATRFHLARAVAPASSESLLFHDQYRGTLTYTLTPVPPPPRYCYHSCALTLWHLFSVSIGNFEFEWRFGFECSAITYRWSNF